MKSLMSINVQSSFLESLNRCSSDYRKPSPKDRANRYAIARGSALECGAILDALLTLSLLPESAHSKAKILLVRIASMLSKLSRPVP